MKKVIPALALVVVAAMACNKQLGSAGSHPAAGLASVTAVSPSMQVSATSFSTSDSLSIIFNGSPADSICWVVTGDSSSPVTGPIYPDSSNNGGTGDTTIVVPPPVNPDSAWLPIDTMSLPPVDTTITYPPPGDSVNVLPPYHSIPALPGGDSAAPVYVAVCSNLNTAGLHNSGYYANPACAIRLNGRAASFKLRKPGSFVVIAKAYTPLANGSYALHKTGYVSITLH